MDIDIMLRDAHPAAPDTTHLQEGLDELYAGVTGPAAAHGPRRRRRRVLTVAAVTAVGLTAGGLAAAGTFTTHTGTCCYERGDRSEVLDKGAPDFVPYARSITRDIEFAPGYSAEPYWPYLTRPAPDGNHELMSATGVRGVVADWASCTWQWTWQDATAGADKARAQTAVAALYRAADTRILHQINNSTWTRQIADAAAAGDPQGFLARNVHLNCPPRITR